MHSSRFVVCYSGFSCRSKYAQGDRLFVHLDNRSPFSAIFTLFDSSITRSVITSNLCVCLILSGCAFTQIRYSVVKSVVVDVVRHFKRVYIIELKNQAMHVELPKYSIFIALVSDCIKSLTVFIPTRIPPPLHEPAVKMGIHNGILSLRERYLSTNFPLDDETLFNYGRTIRSAFCALVISYRLEAATFRTIRYLTGIKFARLISWLGDQLSLVHFSPLREMCGLATLESF